MCLSAVHLYLFVWEAKIRKWLSGSVAHLVACLTCNQSVMTWTYTIKRSCFFLEQETLPLLFSTKCCWFQEWIWACVHNQTKINWGPYSRMCNFIIGTSSCIIVPYFYFSCLRVWRHSEVMTTRSDCSVQWRIWNACYQHQRGLVCQ